EQFYDHLFSQFKKVLIITGHDLAERIAYKYPHLKEVAKIIIPKQPKYFKETRIHYPDVFNETMLRIESLNLKGYLCLVGAGFIGKPYIVKCAERGGIAIDIGSVFDKWAGYVTRGKGKGFEIKNPKYEI
nr:hypothetical protein [Bacteroidota bacterium]